MPAPSEPEVASAAPVPSTGPTTNPDPPRVDLDFPPNTIDETKRPAVEAAPPPSAAPAKAPPPDDVPPPPSGRDLAAPQPATPIAIVIAEAGPESVPTTTRQPAEARPDAVVARAASAASALAAASPPRAVSPSGRELTLDFDALERAAQETSTPSASLFNSADLPPPPKNLFAHKEPGTGGSYRTVDSVGRHGHDPREESTGRSDPREEPVARPSKRAPPAVRREESPQPGRAATRSSPPGRPGGDARYAPARPAAIFGNTQRPQPQSLFSDELVSDKSLDEVILSYLAEDLEPPRRK